MAKALKSKPTAMNKKLRTFLIILLVILLIGVAFVWQYASGAAEPQATAAAIMQQPNISTEGGLLRFDPPAAEQKIGVIFYQGGLVEPAAYAPILQTLAEAGYPVFEPQMPINLAVLGSNRASTIIEDNPQITTWVIGGHSLGGAMAAQFADNNPDAISGLFLLAAYPPNSADMSASNLPVLSIFASNDGLATTSKIEQSAELLPADTIFIEIDGGNHAQFGDYGVQDNDGVAQISAETQWQQTTAAILQFLAALDTSGR